ncbi:MAG: tRNA preQ1(34) S-adenosylmethionine ribosyltransferase-isomerase QueA [Clostridiales bacterium]|nr:tRNA preQ1(34) S-adenosylmethionine ribosyltransferase-isomerase QueA [Clostridiales bacterium]
MKRSDFYYGLPPELIAQHPTEPRDSSRLLVYDRATGAVADKRFFEIADYLRAGDTLVINNTRVIPARLFGQKESGAAMEFLLHKRRNLTEWEVLAKPARRARVGDVFVFSPALKCAVLSEGEGGLRNVGFIYDGVFEDILRSVGNTPLPHYIRGRLDDPERYQTVYAKTDGSSAVPTAGLHFTPELLQKLRDNGVRIAEVLLHVGLGTFRPVKTESLSEHKMHAEYYEISKESADIINATRSRGGRIVAVGTTSVRVLESAAKMDSMSDIVPKNGSKSAYFVEPTAGNTEIFIYPPYEFKLTDALITNFHLPESTLIMLVSAFAGRENTLNFYNYAIKNNYRFFSFGDACLIL